MNDAIDYFRADFEYDAQEALWYCTLTVNDTTFHGKASKPIDAYEFAERELKAEGFGLA